MIGEEGISALEKSLIVIVGVGGVGSNAANALARAGAKNLRFIDFDQVTFSSLNRHALAIIKDVGQSKVEVLRKRILKYSPHAHIETFNEMLSEENVAELLHGDVMYVLDCIDDVPSKTVLIEYCLKQSIKVMSSMGAGARIDPTSIHIGNLDQAKGNFSNSIQ